MRRRRWVTLAALVGACAVLLSACGSNPPAGVDGNMTDDWSGFSEPVGFEPVAEVCHPEAYQQTAAASDYQPVQCDQSHLVETVHVGTFEGKPARRDTPPATDSGAHRKAYQQCEQQAADYLGADFRRGRLWLGVALPSELGWAGGARWFRCELMEIRSVYGEPVEREQPLAGALDKDGDTDLRLRCYTVEVNDSDVQEMQPVSCKKSHDAEFVGTWRAPDGKYPDHADSDSEEQVYDGCREQVAKYVDVPVDDDLVFRTGAIADWMSEEDWAAGDRAFRCYLWLPDRNLKQSLKGDGADALPIQTEE